MRGRNIILASKVLSSIFAPFYLPLVGLIGLLIFSYLSLLPWTYKLFLLVMVYLFTIFLPMVLIRVYNRYQGISFLQFGSRQQRIVPYVISIISYMLCYYFMAIMHVPHFVGNIIIAALIIQIACAVVNLFLKISTHTAAIGGVVGAIMAFSARFSFNPVWWLSIMLLLAGLVGTSRMILRQHSLREVVLGFLLGAVCAFLSVLLL
ncbi:MAG: phosphatase PAP2 family protein [Prevotella sp.]|nr:phosphatase PAP2 family protein [Prevotella sp.]